jgi:hypothetical protein
MTVSLMPSARGPADPESAPGSAGPPTREREQRPDFESYAAVRWPRLLKTLGDGWKTVTVWAYDAKGKSLGKVILPGSFRMDGGSPPVAP